MSLPILLFVLISWSNLGALRHLFQLNFASAFFDLRFSQLSSRYKLIGKLADYTITTNWARKSFVVLKTIGGQGIKKNSHLFIGVAVFN